MQSFGMNGLGDGYGSALYEPAQNDLGRRFAMFFPDSRKIVPREDAIEPFSERRPGHGHYLIPAHEFPEFLPLAEGVQFNLVDGRHNIMAQDEILKPVRKEVTNTYDSHFPPSGRVPPWPASCRDSRRKAYE